MYRSNQIIQFFTEKNLPKDLSKIKAIKPGSRNL